MGTEESESEKLKKQNTSLVVSRIFARSRIAFLLPGLAVRSVLRRCVHGCLNQSDVKISLNCLSFEQREEKNKWVCFGANEVKRLVPAGASAG